MATLKAAVRSGIEGIVATHGADSVRIVDDGQGGAWVEITGIDPGPAYEQNDTFLICFLPFNLPAADIYPVFVRPDLTRTDGAGLGEGTQETQLRWPGEPQPRPVVQVSRRTRQDFAEQTPAQKVAKVLDWLATR